MASATLERPAAAESIVREPWVHTPASGTRRSELDAFVASLLDAAEHSVVGASYSASRRRLLRHLETRGSSPIATLVRAAHGSRRQTARILRDLEEDGLVEPRAADRGQPSYTLTADGSRALAATRAVQIDLITELLRSLASDSAAHAGEAYRRLRAALGSPRDEDGDRAM